MDIFKAEVVLKDLVDSTDRMDGHPLQFTSAEFKEAYDVFVEHAKLSMMVMDDLNKLAEGSAELYKRAKDLHCNVSNLYPKWLILGVDICNAESEDVK